MKHPPSMSYNQSVDNLSSFESACEYLFIHNTSPGNIFHLLFTQKKNYSSEKKFGIFVNLLSQGVDLEFELTQNKNLASELAEYFDVDDDGKSRYFENNIAKKLAKFKHELQRIPRIEKLPNLKEIYLKSLTDLNRISMSYHHQTKDFHLDLVFNNEYSSKITQEEFISLEFNDEIENILNFMGFLNYLKDSKFIDFIYNRMEEHCEKHDKLLLNEEEQIYNSVNGLIDKLSPIFDLSINKESHLKKIQLINSENERQYLLKRNLFLTEIKRIMEINLRTQEENKVAKIKEEAQAKKQLAKQIKKQSRRELKEVKEIVENIVLNAFQQITDKAKQEADEKAKKELEEELRKKAEIKTKKLQIKEERRRLRELEIIKQQNAKEIKERIIEKSSTNFEKFQLFFNYLRNKKWLEIGEIGLFGSRVYRCVITETCPQITVLENPQTDFDFYCVPKESNSSGIFRLCHDESASRENFKEILEEFNSQNYHFQIYLKDEKHEDNRDEFGKKSVNLKKGSSLNFKLIALFQGEEIDQEKEDLEEIACKKKIAKIEIEFDLNFYTQDSILTNLQWQYNLERVILVQKIDQSWDLVINSSNCELSDKESSFEEFIINAKEREIDQFLMQPNPQAHGYLHRILNKNGAIKYFPEEIANVVQGILLANDFIKENLKKELLTYKKIVEEKSLELGESEIINEKYKKAKFILDEVSKNKIFKEDKDLQEILKSNPKTTPCEVRVDTTKIENEKSL